MAKKEKVAKQDKVTKKDKKNKRHPFKDFKAELKKVIWPTPKQLLNSTVAVITIVLIVGVIVFVLDFSFNALNQYGSKLQSKLRENTNTTATEENTTSEENPDEASSEENEVVENEEVQEQE